jgi:hypothetical protein
LACVTRTGVGDFATFLGEPFDEAMTYAALRKAESVGRPAGSREWLAEMGHGRASPSRRQARAQAAGDLVCGGRRHMDERPPPSVQSSLAFQVTSFLDELTNLDRSGATKMDQIFIWDCPLII